MRETKGKWPERQEENEERSEDGFLTETAGAVREGLGHGLGSLVWTPDPPFHAWVTSGNLGELCKSQFYHV